MVLPRCQENHTLKHFLFEHQSQLSINHMGIPEPQSGKVVPTKNIDIIFVPLLALDKNGNRVGYGKGYYDRFLKKCRTNCTFIGLHLFEEFVEISDLNITDVPLHYCVTPEQIKRFVQ
jgi:5-formyltetrahydrofolate cyclo-ligase